MANELILNIPFQGTAVDTGPNAVPVVLTGATFQPGRVDATGTMQSAYFDGDGQAEIIPHVIPVDGSYTLECWILAKQTGEGPMASWVLVKFQGEGRFLYLDLYNDLTSWTYLVIEQDTDAFRVRVNGRIVSTEAFPDGWGKPTGFCVLNDNPSHGAGWASIEDVRVYQGLTNDITIPPISQMDLTYSVNGQDFKGFGVYVSESDGIIDNLTMKEPFRVEWDDYHGEVVDLSRPRYQPRDITLSCFIQGVGRDEFLDRVKVFLNAFTQPNTQRLMLNAHTTKPLVYEVYLRETVNLKKKWSESLMVGTFELKLREPEPVKRVLKFGAGTVTITLSSAKMLNVFWGDKTVTRDVYGTNITLTHTYPDSVDHYIIIAGVIEDIFGYSSNATIVWNKL